MHERRECRCVCMSYIQSECMGMVVVIMGYDSLPALDVLDLGRVVPVAGTAALVVQHGHQLVDLNGAIHSHQQTAR